MTARKSKYSHLTYARCKAILEEAQNRGTGRVKLAPVTYLSRNGDEFAVYFHAEPILTFLPGGGVRYDRCGGRTRETPLIREAGGVWIVTGEQERTFEDGMIIGGDPQENELVKDRANQELVLRDYRIEKGYIRAT